MRSPMVMLAESDHNDANLVLLAIERAAIGADVAVFSDGEAVVDFFLKASNGRRFASPCDLLLLDLDLPKLDGLKVLRQLRWLHRDDVSKLPPIVVLSACDEPDLVAAAFRHGASGFLCKAARAFRFVDNVQQTMSYWLRATMCPTRHQPAISVRSQSTTTQLDSSQFIFELLSR